MSGARKGEADAEHSKAMRGGLLRVLSMWCIPEKGSLLGSRTTWPYLSHGHPKWHVPNDRRRCQTTTESSLEECGAMFAELTELTEALRTSPVSWGCCLASPFCASSNQLGWYHRNLGWCSPHPPRWSRQRGRLRGCDLLGLTSVKSVLWSLMRGSGCQMPHPQITGHLVWSFCGLM